MHLLRHMQYAAEQIFQQQSNSKTTSFVVVVVVVVVLIAIVPSFQLPFLLSFLLKHSLLSSFLQ
jgi:flagellar biosynthesis component FlhA